MQSSAAALAASVLGADAQEITQGKTRRVGLIGAGWYGKSDLWRLVQVAPVEIVSVCDPDKQMLAGAVEIAQQRQKSKKAPETYGDHRQMLKDHKFDIVLIGSPDHWHALNMIDAVKADKATSKTSDHIPRITPCRRRATRNGPIFQRIG